METPKKQFRKRNAILACLQQTKSHPSAEMLHEMLKQDNPDISLPTVYRNLTHFKQLGLIISLGQVNGVERFDACIAPHAHLVCSCCGRVDDVEPELVPQVLSMEVSQSHGWQLDSAQVTFSGICPDCQKNDLKNINN